MKEKCPVCQRGDIVSKSSLSVPSCLFGCTCCCFQCCEDQLPNIAAAMELARAAVWADECEAQRDYMDDTTSNHDAWRSIVNLELDAHHGACDAHDRVIEVFGGE